MSPALGNLPANADYAALLPAFVVAIVPLLVLFLDLFFRQSGPARRGVAVGIAIVGLLAAGFLAAEQYPKGKRSVTLTLTFPQIPAARKATVRCSSSRGTALTLSVRSGSCLDF